jgi:hypothetical protein
MELFDCPNCGRGPWTIYEIENGLCPFCQEEESDEDELWKNFLSGEEDNDDDELFT